MHNNLWIISSQLEIQQLLKCMWREYQNVIFADVLLCLLKPLSNRFIEKRYHSSSLPGEDCWKSYGRWNEACSTKELFRESCPWWRWVNIFKCNNSYPWSDEGSFSSILWWAAEYLFKIRVINAQWNMHGEREREFEATLCYTL